MTELRKALIRINLHRDTYNTYLLPLDFWENVEGNKLNLMLVESY